MDHQGAHGRLLVTATGMASRIVPVVSRATVQVAMFAGTAGFAHRAAGALHGGAQMRKLRPYVARLGVAGFPAAGLFVAALLVLPAAPVSADPITITGGSFTVSAFARGVYRVTDFALTGREGFALRGVTSMATPASSRVAISSDRVPPAIPSRWVSCSGSATPLGTRRSAVSTTR